MDSQDSHCRTELLGTGSWERGLRGGGLGAGAGAGAEKSWKGGGGKEDDDDEGRLRVRVGRMERLWWWVTESRKRGGERDGRKRGKEQEGGEKIDGKTGRQRG